MNTAIPNYEEAANVAAEFIYNIDNLPQEVAHILQEIRQREIRTQELQHEIDRDSSRYIRHSRKGTTPMPMATSASTPSASGGDSISSPGSRAESTTPAGASTPVSIPVKISTSYSEIHELAAEKTQLAERLIEMITRARTKLDIDLAKVRLLQGEPPDLVSAHSSASVNLRPAGLVGLPSSLSASGSSGLDSFGAPGRNPALAISESLRNALAIPSAPATASSPAIPLASVSAIQSNKKRRTGTSTSIKISPANTPKRSASPAAAAPVAHNTQRSRLSRQIHPPVVEDMDMDADGDGDDEDADMEEDNEDETLYCFCQKRSYGDMIACDNEGDCPYEWFHLPCVGLKQPPSEKWFCSECVVKLNITTAAQGTPTPAPKKGRKK